MVKDVQQQGGTFENQNVFVGLPRQITVEIDNWRILLHDGVTPGGHMFIDRDEGDQRWQIKNEELGGFADFPVPGRGLLVRLGVGNYAVRTLESEAPIHITYPDGQVDNPYFALDTIIPGERTFSGEVTFAQPTTGEKWVGDTEGNHVGDTEGIHTGDIIGNVTGNLQGNSEGNHVGGLDARDAELFFGVDQIPKEAVNGLIAALQSIPGALPSGIIVDWSGTAENVPSGWFLCDGQNGTPDLRGLFIRGASEVITAHSTGGSSTSNTAGTIQEAGEHSHEGEIVGHALTIAELPSHFHANGVTDSTTDLFNHGNVAANPNTADSIDNNASNGIYEGKTTSVGGDQEHSHGATINLGGVHTHVFEGGAINVIPSYYALCKIMKA